MSRSLRSVLPLLLSAPLLAACGDGQPLTRLVTLERKPPAGLTAACRAHPVPGEIRTDGELALYMVELAAAGEDCRQKHTALAKWAQGS